MKNFRFAAAATLVALSSPAAAAPPDAAQVLASRYIAWRGGSAFVAMRAVHASGTLTLGGMNGVVDRWTATDGDSVETRDMRVFSVAEAVAGRGGWTRSPAGQVATLPPFTALVESRLVQMASGTPWRARGARLTYRGSETLNGQRWGVLRATFADGDPYELLIDEATGELGAERHTDAGRQTVVKFADWRTVAGVKLAFEESTEETGAPPIHARFSQIDLAARIPAAAIARKPGARHFTFTDGGASSGDVAFELWDASRLFVPIEVNGHAITALVDTAAAGSVIDAGLASQLGIDAQGAFRVQGATGGTGAGMARDVALSIGRLKIAGAPITVMDLSSLAGPLGRQVPLVLGKDVLDQLVVDVDFARRAIRFDDPDRFTPARGARALPAVPMEGGLRAIRARIAGERDGLFHVDFGNSTPLLLYPDAADRARGRAKRVVPTRVGGIVGSAGADALTAPSLAVGGETFSRVPVIAMRRAPGGLTPAHVDGNLGLPVFARFDVTLDYPHDRIWLRAIDRSDRPFDHDRTGLTLKRDGDALHVDAVVPESPAADAGLKAGDRIIAIGDRRIGADYVGSGLSRWRYAAAAEHVTVTLGDGARRTLMLRDYY